MMTQPVNTDLHQSGDFKAVLRSLLGFRLGQFYVYSPRPIALSASYAKPVACQSVLKISLITPVLNQVQFIEQTIESVLTQGFPALEYVVMDGGSKDGTTAIIDKYSDQLTYSESARDKGQSDAINRGFAHTSGDILGWINADDTLLPGALDYVAHFFEMNPNIDVVYGNRIVIDEDGNEIGRWILPPHSDRILSWIDYVPQETLFWRRDLWNRVGGSVDTSFEFAMDWDLLVRFRDCGARFSHLPRYLGAFRVHPSQKTSARMNDLGAQEMDRIRIRCLGYVPSKLRIRIAVMPYVLQHIICGSYTSLLEMLEGAYYEYRFRRSSEILADKVVSLAFSDDQLPSGIESLTGFSEVEKWGRWTSAKNAVIEFSSPLPSHFRFEATVAQIFGDNKIEPVLIRVGKNMRFVHLQNSNMSISLDFHTDGKTDTIEIIPGKPQSPSQLGLSSDSRLLGLGFSNLKITPLTVDSPTKLFNNQH